MDTEALIEALARETTPIPARSLDKRILLSLAGGATLALGLVLGWLGLRPDLPIAISSGVFWGKAAFTLASGLIGLGLTLQLARPDVTRLRGAWPIGVPMVMLLVAAFVELAGTSPASRTDLVIQPSWSCVPLILLIALPLGGALLWALKQAAPTRQRAAGAAAGLTAAGFAATLYCLYCQQASPTYVLTRYTVAIALVAAFGALLGPRLLRW